MASMLMLLVLVPILKALTSAHLMDVKIEHKMRSLTLAEAKLENIRAQSIYDWDINFDETSSSVDGSYLCTVVDASVAGPLSSILRRITVSVGYDGNNNSVLDSGEVEATIDTFIAKRWP